MTLNEILAPSPLPLSDFITLSSGLSDYRAGRLLDGYYAKDLSLIGFMDDVPEGRAKTAATAMFLYLDKLTEAGLEVGLVESSPNANGGFRVSLFEIVGGIRSDLLGFDVAAVSGGWNMTVTEQLEETAIGVSGFCQSAGL